MVGYLGLGYVHIFSLLSHGLRSGNVCVFSVCVFVHNGVFLCSLAGNSQNPACLCLPIAGSKGMCHDCLALNNICIYICIYICMYIYIQISLKHLNLFICRRWGSCTHALVSIQRPEHNIRTLFFVHQLGSRDWTWTVQLVSKCFSLWVTSLAPKLPFL